MNDEKPPRISIRKITKIFGEQEKRALAMLEAGKDKHEILKVTDCNVGLNRVSMDIAAGQIFVIMGLSGSGKSTLVRHINRLIDPTAGEIFVDNEAVLQFNAEQLREFRRRKISMVFQGFGLLPQKSVLDNVAYGLKVRGEKRESRNSAAQKWLESVGLLPYKNKFPDELSGGMKQRVGLARALAMDTDIILMDEAFSALDPLIRAEMQDQLLELQRTIHKTIVFITHDIDEAFRIGNHIAILRDGQLVQMGTAREIVNQPVDDYVRRFVEKRDTIRSASIPSRPDRQLPPSN